MKLKTLRMLIQFIVGVFFLYFLIHNSILDLSQVKLMLISKWTILGFPCIIISFFFFSIRWKVLLYSVGLNLRLNEIARLTFIGIAFNTIIPGGVGGDIVKTYYLTRGRRYKFKAISTVILNRIVGLFSTLILSLGAICGVLIFGRGIINPIVEFRNLQILGLFIIILLTLLVIGFIIAMSDRFRRNGIVQWTTTKAPGHVIIKKLYDALYEFKHKKYILFLTTIISIIGQFPLILSFYFFGKSFENILTFVHYLFLAPIAFLLNTIPLGPGGLGTGEAFVYALFKLFGSMNGANINAVFHIEMIIISIICYILFVFGDKSTTKTYNTGQNIE